MDVFKCDSQNTFFYHCIPEVEIFVFSVELVIRDESELFVYLSFEVVPVPLNFRCCDVLPEWVLKAQIVLIILARILEWNRWLQVQNIGRVFNYWIYWTSLTTVLVTDFVPRLQDLLYRPHVLFLVPDHVVKSVFEHDRLIVEIILEFGADLSKSLIHSHLLRIAAVDIHFFYRVL